MIIIDTKASDYKIIDGITNIPLYDFKPLKYKIRNTDYTDFIFQSTQAVLKFSNHINLLKKKNIRFLKESGVLSEEINVYERIELKDYKALKNKFKSADAIIFPSVYAIEIFLREIYTKNTNTKDWIKVCNWKDHSSKV